ncbi:MAG TPA: 3-octaprenyl-4-hydroxybenzoate carboxy-lyase, partial [Planctomycetaceae bacterium]|nr:3-octaprenyl-4-hydroxybenzoate carboxy-lyase [Planctomycetaceae bacterium]
YSLTHDFPVVDVEHVYHRDGAVWPFTVVGRPPQEDTVFGDLIHEITGPAIPAVLPGVHAVHAVDESGVHPLLLAIGSERYVPYAEDRVPQELLTNASAILGQGQLSLAKYLIIAAYQDNPDLNVRDVSAFLQHILERVDWTRDLHFQTRTTIDTLDYSGTGLNAGSKLVIAAAGRARRGLASALPADLSLPDGFDTPRVCLPGVLAVTAPKWNVEAHACDLSPTEFCSAFERDASINGFPLIVLVDDAEFCAASLSNFLWCVFTRSNPANDVYGIESFVEHKHFGCHGSLVIDARLKTHHAPPLECDPAVTSRVDELFASGRSLHGIA